MGVGQVVTALLLTLNFSTNAFANGSSDAPNGNEPNTNEIEARSMAVLAAQARRDAWIAAGKLGCTRLITNNSEAKVARHVVMKIEATYTILAERQNGEQCRCSYSDHALTAEEVGFACERSI